MKKNKQKKEKISIFDKYFETKKNAFIVGTLIGIVIIGSVWIYSLNPKEQIEEYQYFCQFYSKQYTKEKVQLIGKAFENCYLAIDENRELFWKCKNFASPIGYTCNRDPAYILKINEQIRKCS